MAAPRPQIITEDRASSAEVIEGNLEFKTKGTDFAAGTYLTRTPSSAGNTRQWTWSAWVMRNGMYSNGNNMFAAYVDDNNRDTIRFGGLSADCYEYQNYDGGNGYGNRTNAVYRDTIGWYHVVIAYDSTLGSNRVKYYINGTQITSLTNQGGGAVTSNQNSHINTTGAHYIGARKDSSGVEGNFDGRMSQAYFIDGQALEATEFGYTDPLTNTWRPKKFILPYKPNSGQSWSGMCSGGTDSGNEHTKAFDGADNTSCYPSPGSTVTMTIPAGKLKYTTSFEAWVSRDANGGVITVNGGSNVTPSGSGFQIVDLSGQVAAGADITEITWARAGSGSIGIYMIYIVIDGVALMDDDLTNMGVNGFYLPFDGSAPIGQDQSGKGNHWNPVSLNGTVPLDKATGALPILNTINGGNIAASGVRGQTGVAVTVYNSGSGNKYYLDGVEAASLSFVPGQNVTFYTSDSTVSGHPFRLSGTANGSHNAFYSVDFDGTGDYLTIPDSSDWDYGTGDFTVECWVMMTGGSGNRELFSRVGSGQFQFSVDGNNFPRLYHDGSNNFTTTEALQTNVWTHLAAVRENGVFTFYIDGIENISDSFTSNLDGSHGFGVAATEAGAQQFTGKISDLRVVKGTAVYTSNFTPPSTPLTNISGTVLLCCNQSTTTGSTVTPGTITANGDPTSSNDNPYDTYLFGTVTGASEGSAGAATTITIPNNAPSNLYYYCTNHSGMGGSISIGAIDSITADPYAWKNLLALPLLDNTGDLSNQVNGSSTTKTATASGAVSNSIHHSLYTGSYYFDGSNDEIVISSSDFSPGKGPFTIEAWFNQASSGTQRILTSGNNTSSSQKSHYQMVVKSDGAVEINYDTTAGHVIASAAGLVGINEWHHFAMTRDSSSPPKMSIWLDGKEVASGTSNTGFNSNNTEGIVIGRESTGSSWWNGYIQDVRFYNKICKYTQDFLVGSPQCDIKMGSSSGVSYSSKLTKTTSGGVSGDASTSDYLQMASSSDFSLDGDFTVEWWYFRSTKANAYMWTLHDSNTSTGLELYWGSSGAVLNLYTNGSATNQNSTYRSGWSHYAVVRSGSTITAYYNGVAQSGTLSNSNTFSGNVTIGGEYYNGAITGGLSGPISNFRLVKGTAVYTQNFAPPTSPLTNITNTKLLCCQGGSPYNYSPVKTGTAKFNLPLSSAPFTDSSSNTYTVTNVGSVTTASAGTNNFNITNAASFDGSSQRLNMNSNVTLTGSWTIDAWIKLDSSASGYNAIYNSGYTSSNNTYIYVGINDDEKPYLEGGSAGGTSAATNAINKNQWYHFRAIQDAGGMHLYVDGVKVVTHGKNTTDMSSLGTDTIGSLISNGNNANNFHGLIGPVRYVTSTLGPPPVGGLPTTAGALSNTPDISMEVVGSVAATTSNPFDTSDNYALGKPSGYATWNRLKMGTSDVYMGEGNLYWKTTSNGPDKCTYSTLGMDSGKFYWENEIVEATATGVGIANILSVQDSGPGAVNNWMYYSATGQTYLNNTGAAYGQAFNTNGITIGVAFDRDNLTLEFFREGVSQGKLTNISGLKDTETYYAMCGDSGGASQSIVRGNFGQKPFKYTPPDGFGPLCLSNLPSPGNARPDQYMKPILWSGGNSGSGGLTRHISTTFQPDLVWIKQRNQAYSTGWQLYDSVRGGGAEKEINCSSTGAEGAGNIETYGWLESFNKTGFTVKGGSNDYDYVDKSSVNYVAYCWKAGGNSNTFNVDGKGYASAAAAGLTAGSVTPTGASVGTTQGFSIIKWTAPDPQNNSATIPHGLTQKPNFWLVKSLDSTADWICYTEQIDGSLDFAHINNTETFNGSSATVPTSTTFGVYGNDINTAGDDLIAYLWHDVPGVQKFGIYKANNSTDGPYVDLGFKPALICIKSATTSGSARNWALVDSTRSYANVANHTLAWNGNWAESSFGGGESVFGAYNKIDLLSNGFKIRDNGNWCNESGATYFYMAWAKSPFHNLYGGQSNAR